MNIVKQDEMDIAGKDLIDFLNRPLTNVNGLEPFDLEDCDDLSEDTIIALDKSQNITNNKKFVQVGIASRNEAKRKIYVSGPENQV
jgi:hypothetical protein